MTNLHDSKGSASRRSFLKQGLTAGGAVMGAGLLAGALPAQGRERDDGGGDLPRGDAAILRFLAALEIIESDLWQQYNELGGIQDKTEVPGGSGSGPYTAALVVLDPDMPQYIHDNTEDEISHFTFLNAYLDAKGEEKIDLKPFRLLQGSMATGSQQIARITNLLQLTVDTSWWTRYRSRTENPDLDPGFQFPQAVPALSVGQHPAIPVTDADLSPNNHIQAIANTAGFHFAFIEQGGTSLYPSLAQRVTHPEVLRILLSIGPTETAHFQTWHDKAGNAPAITDPNNPKLIFPNLNASPFGGEDFQSNLIMPEPCPFLRRKFPPVSIIRPTETNGAAMGALRALTADGLFIGQSPQFFEFMRDLAEDADAARSER
ncbi:MAG: ferritin-like domain-containing protein [Terriglobia bacterium]